MKKNYFFVLFAALFCMAMPTAAQVSTMADLYGKYKFSATMEVLDNNYDGKFSNDCEVTISKASSIYYLAEMKGLAGLAGYMAITDIDTKSNTFKILNPNHNVGAEELYFSDITGKMNIFTGDSTVYSDIDYAYDPVTKVIAIPDFTLVTKDGEQKADAIIAKFTNAKLTLVEAEGGIEIADLSGDWHFKAAASNTMEDSTLPTEWDMTLTSTNEDNSAYDITLTLGDFAPLALAATFDGIQLTIPFDETYFDEENKIGIVNMYGEVRPGEITFNMANENLLSLYSGMTIAQDSISPEVKGGYLQWYVAGSAKRQSGEEATDTWDGTYKVKGSVVDVTIADYTYPAEFDMEVVYYEAADMYLITKFFGQDVTALNWGGIQLTPSADDPNKAEIKTGTYLQTIVGGETYLYLMDDDVANSPITITRNEDGTYTIDNFTIACNSDFAAAYENVTAEKAAAEKPEEFSWASTFTLKAGNIEVYNDAYTYPSEFEMEVQYYEEWDIYLVTKFFGQDVTALNNGGIGFSVSADDPNKAEMTTGRYLQTIVAGESYLCLMDMNLSTSPLTLTHNEDGTITISDFCISLMTYDANGNQSHTAAALYKFTEPFGINTVSPAEGASVTKVERIQFEFNKDVTVTMPEGGIEVKNTTTNEVFKLTRLYENEYMPKNNVIIEFEQVMTEGKDGKEELTNQIVTTPGAYTYTIPAGMIKSTDGEDFAEQTFTFNIVGTFPVDEYSPAEAEKIEKIELTFSKEIAEVADLSKLNVTDTYYYSPVAYVSGYTISEDKKTVTLTLDNAITGAGWYEFVIYEGIFTSADGEVNAYAGCWLNVIDNTPGFVTSLNDGDRVQQLGNTLEITFKNVNEVKLAEGEDAPKATVYLPSTSDVEGTAVYADGKITVTFDQQFTEEGDYLFVIPEGMFTMDGVANEKREMNVTLFTFTVTPLEVVSVTPVAGAVDSISKIVVKFNQIVSPSYDEEGLHMISQEITLTCGDQQYTLTYAPEGWNATDEVIYLVNAEWDGYEFASTPIVAEGTYTLNLADIVVDHAGEEGVDEWGYPTTIWHSKGQSCTGTYTWTIGDTAVEGIEAEDGEQVIYDLLGRRVEKITGAGLYIVNGKKVLVK